MTLVLDRSDVRRLVTTADAITVIQEAFAAADRGEAVMPAPPALRLPEADGELHAKGAYLSGAPVFVVKSATGFYQNPSRGLPASGGMALVYDAVTGRLRAVEGADLVITATCAAEPLIQDGWLVPGTHVTAVGADMPHKQELDPRILGAAGKCVPDSVEAAAKCGELHHAIRAGVLEAASAHGELGAAIAGLVTRLAEEQDAGLDVALGRCDDA
ncbi:MAG TPA: hypothetical protein VFA45_14405 [Actinomycetes bacterium]|nr:hypothetical protein [Actinomycetes bacterium]